MKSYISSIGTANPGNKFSQMNIAEFMVEATQLNREALKKLKAIYRASGIEYRYSVLPDFGNKNRTSAFFSDSCAPSVSERMKIYEKEALPLSLRAIEDCLKGSGVRPKQITHLITVSCTGMYAPGLDIEITTALGLSSSIQRTSIQYMGCYAAFNALKVADAFCRSNEEAVVLIVCIELCTIHYKNSTDWDALLSNSLFGDGAAAVLVQAGRPEKNALSLESFYCDIAFEGKTEMAWHISDFGFEMTLSSYVPALIKSGIKKLTENLLAGQNLALSSIDHFAIHPGGKKILEVIEEELKIERSRTQSSFKVLREFGNMSSPSILFVLKDIFDALKGGDHNKHVVSFAFGPGLTMESMILKTSCISEKSSLQANEKTLLKENIA